MSFAHWFDTFQITYLFSTQFAYIGLPYLFYKSKGVGLWLWAPSSVLCFSTLPDLHGIAIFFTKVISLQTCRDCGSELIICPICREPITSRQRFTSSDCSHRIENVRLNLAAPPKIHRLRAHQ